MHELAAKKSLLDLCEESVLFQTGAITVKKKRTFSCLAQGLLTFLETPNLSKLLQ